MMPPDDTRNEEQFASLLKKAETDAVPPDPELLERLRVESTQAFTESRAAKAQHLRKHVLRWLSAAAALVLGVGLYFLLGPGQSARAFGRVLEDLEKAPSLHVRVSTRHGPGCVEFWHTSEPSRSRWDSLDGRYQIAAGSIYWIVDEKQNQARRVEPPPDAARPMAHLLELLGLPPDPPALFKALPVERIQDRRGDMLMYRLDVPSGGRIVSVEALVFADTGRLCSMATKSAGDGDIGELIVLAHGEPIGAEKFVIADTLTEDGRIGEVVDVQGIVTVKPATHERWTPARNRLVLRPGDWVRTDARGANATALRLVKNAGVILGPKTLVELVGPKQIRVAEGEIEITAPPGAAIELVGPGRQTVPVKGKQSFRIVKQKLERLTREPAWLLGFRGAVAHESLGSLVARVDGRNVPLTVGYHKVSVDVRDQIARTIIEESFVNHTDAQLEGIFYFPLPENASISGFGMWIGDNLIEADVVEKQRAREIYETILRERRDPGLLEWSGGNIFKARVFPILPHAEKRIKITYTQVLPLQGSRYRYSYALQSELLQQHPLRELAIDVRVNSTLPLKSVTSPTHSARIEHTVHSGRVEFTAQEYTPARDFEVAVEIDGRRPDVVMIPHRRGDDGYFMLQLTPPGTSGDWQRPLLPEGPPVRLLILADTSASIDAGQRIMQSNFIGSVLAALTPKDTFNLATCDVTCDWAFAQPVPAVTKNINRARDFLAGRTSLGWTNLDVAFASAMKQCDSATHVVYVGDGIVTAGDGDAVAFTKRLRLLYSAHASRSAGTYHAVALGSSHEPVVLKAIAELGGGSMRKITTEQGPQTVALELLGEIAQPALRDVQVEFKGLSVARVFPEVLSNIASGTQQIILGRYLPQGKDQVGEVIVSGKQAGKPVRFGTHVSLQDAEHGNSFIPRLWARMYLDHLLEQGNSEVIRDEIIALSEEYQIITPYTSFLVLQTDADRERFKVKRGFRMRDGEKFFVEGRDKATFDLKQKQMKQAGDWRVALRRSILRQLSSLGRNPRVFQPRGRGRNEFDEPTIFFGLGGLGPLSAGEVPLGDLGIPEDAASKEVENFLTETATPTLREDDEIRAATKSFDMKLSPLDMQDGLNLLSSGDVAESREKMIVGGEYQFGLGGIIARDPGLFARTRPYYNQWLNTLFPQLRPVPRKAKEPKSTWPAAAHELAQSLLRTSQLGRMTGGIEIVRRTDAFDVRWSELTGRSHRLELFSANSWLTRSGSDGGQTIISWCNPNEHGVFSMAFQLGRLRDSVPGELQPPPLDLNDYSLTSIEKTYAGYTPSLQPQGQDHIRLRLTDPSDSRRETHILIDTKRHVILSIEQRYRNKTTYATKFDDFVEAAGSWWARRIETTDENGKRLSLITQSIRPLTIKDVKQQMARELTGRDRVQFFHEPLPSILTARRAIAAGKQKFDDHFALLLHFSQNQQWKRVLDHLHEAEKRAEGKPGMRWLRSALLFDSRRHEELRKRYQEDAARLAGTAPFAEEYFLAEYIVGRSGSILQANEMLALLDALRSIYDRQPGPVQGQKRWQHLRAAYLSQAGRTDEALRLRKELAAKYPHDSGLQGEYVRALAESGDYSAAHAWLTKVLSKEARWLDHEEDSLRTTYAELLQQQGRYDELVRYLAGWVEQGPNGRSAYEQYLSALIRSDQVEKADAIVAQWLKEAQVPTELSPAVQSRLSAAINLMLGQGYGLYTNRIEERWLAPLAKAALFFARRESGQFATDQIMSHHAFRASDEGRQLRKTFAGILAAEIGKMPAKQMQRFANWIGPDDAGADAWAKILAGMRSRWLSETRADAKHFLGQTLNDVLTRHGNAGDALAFLRLQWQKGPEKHRAEYANQLFSRLLAQPWSAAYEDEAFSLIGKLESPETEEGRHLFSAVAALHRLTDTMVEGRYAARMKTIEHQEKLTRIELQQKKNENQRLARAGFADRLAKEIARQPKALTPWLVVERLYLDVTLDRNLKQAESACWQYLSEVREATGAQRQQPPSLEETLDDILRQRYWLTLMNLAARKSAGAALVERLLKYIDQQITTETDEGRWKLARIQLLIARDRPRELEQTLPHWIQRDSVDSRWRIILGYLLAEQGRVAEAIKQFEAVEAADELRPAEYRALAGWYLVENRREQHDQALAAVYRTTAEYQLYRLLDVRLRPWRRSDGHLPTELDKEVLAIFTALFENSASPQSYLYQLQMFYQACHDFRLLAVLADAVVGHSAARIYPFLSGMQPLLGEIRDEATADELLRHIGLVRKRAATDVDQRALDLLEVLVERRAAEVQNQPGPHVNRALAALKRSFKRPWSPGEPRLMADFLAALGRITQPALAREQLHELKSLHGILTRGTLDRLHVAHRYAAALRDNKRLADGIDLLQTALDEFQQAGQGVLPVSANDALASLVSYYEEAGHFARGEKYLLVQLEHPVHRQQRIWLTERIYNLYHHAMQDGGDTSLGAGVKLYRALERRIQDDLARADQNHRYQLIVLLCRVFRTANDKKFAGVVDDLQTFAFRVAPPYLKQQVNNYDSLITHLAQTLHDLAGAGTGLAFLVGQIEKEPRWLRYSNQDGWSRHAHTLAAWRTEAKNLGPVEGKLLELVLAELRRDLESRESRHRVMYHKQSNSGHYWKEKEADFARTAEEILARRRQSGPSVQYIAEYLYWGIDHRNRAIEILFAAHKQKLLDESGEVQLVDYLHRENRHGESIALLEPLVERRPENIDYRVLLMHAYFRTQRKSNLLALLKQTDAFFHQKDRWTERVMYSLGHGCLQNELYDQSVAYYKELIPLHERTRPGRGIGDGTLAEYYIDLALAYAGLKKTIEAVDAAGGAIVAWGPRLDQRARTLETMKTILVRSADLDAFVAHLDRQNQDSAIVRKAMAQAYHEKRNLARAIQQLQLAAQLQPNDAEIHRMLIAWYDEAKDKEGAARQTLHAAQLLRRDIELYEKLGRRYEALGRAREAERAYTSIVEALPSESESHTLLAEIRQKQHRWPEAISHWEQVARIRSLEPTGLLKLAAAQIHEKQWTQARATLRKLDTRSWPARFGDVHAQVRALENRIDK
jgi:predicted Zn-dependent protease